jgi:FdhD protein
MGAMETMRAEVRRGVGATRVTAVRGKDVTERADRVAGEEPMEIRAAGVGQEPVAVAVTMRTPGRDFELASGFLFTEGLIGPDDIVKVSYCDAVDVDQDFNIVTVRLSRPFQPRAQRNFYATSSCGVCGKASLDEVEVMCKPVQPGPTVARSTVTSLPEDMRKAQKTFNATGGLHAAALFDAAGTLKLLREDVGRHNAVDKVVGKVVLDRSSLAGHILMVSGRTSFEIVQKAAVAGAPIVCAVSAPSSLAVEAAERFGLTLIGFLRGDGFNLYTHPERIDLTA